MKVREGKGYWQGERELLMSMALLRLGAGEITVGELVEALPRKRDRMFVEELVRRRAAGEPMKEASIEAYRVSHPAARRNTDETVYKRVLDKLERPEVNVAAQEILGEAGMGVGELVGIFAQHIRGIEYEVLVEGQSIKVKDKPNYQAARDAIGLILPKAPTKFEGQVAIGVGFMGGGEPPASIGRALPEKRVKRQGKAQDDEL